MPSRSSSPAAWAAFVCATLFFLFEFVARVAPSLAPEDIAAWFGLSNAGFSTLSSLFFWVYAPMQIVVGLLLDRFGARRLVLPASLLCALGMALFALGPSAAIAGLGRLMTGLGASFAFVGALYVVNHRFPAGHFARLSGLVNAVGMLGTAVGVTLLSAAVETAGWRAVFMAVAAAGVAIFALALVFLHDGEDAPRSAPGAQALAPLKPLMRDGRIWLIALVGAFYYMPINVYGGLWGKAELMADRGLDGTTAELAVSMIFWGMAAGSVLSGVISDALGHRKPVLVASALASAACYALALFAPGLGTVSLGALLFLAGLFNGAQMLTFAMAKESQPTAVSGTVIAFVNMIGIAGALVFQPLVGAILDATGSYPAAVLVMPAGVLLAALLGLAIREKRHPDHAV